MIPISMLPTGHDIEPGTAPHNSVSKFDAYMRRLGFVPLRNTHIIVEYPGNETQQRPTE